MGSDEPSSGFSVVLGTIEIGTRPIFLAPFDRTHYKWRLFFNQSAPMLGKLLAFHVLNRRKIPVHVKQISHPTTP
jgi:hypothetical protein